MSEDKIIPKSDEEAAKDHASEDETILRALEDATQKDAGAAPSTPDLHCLYRESVSASGRTSPRKKRLAEAPRKRLYTDDDKAAEDLRIALWFIKKVGGIERAKCVFNAAVTSMTTCGSSNSA